MMRAVAASALLFLLAGLPAAAAPASLTPAQAEAFSDARILPAMKRSGVPGVIVAVVRRGQVLLVKGYGVADVARHTKMDANRTLFDIASITKSMTAIIALQLVEQGRLDLDEDVNRYLRHVRVTGPKVTLRMLLGHCGGFDSDLTGLFVPLGGDISVSDAEMDRRLKPVRAPGVVTSYDNQGFGLIGLVLRDVTGKPIAELYRERIFAPLGTGAVQGRPPDGDARLARCYVVHGPGKLDGCPYWLYREGLRGAGGVAASARRHGALLRMLLNGGVLDGHRLLGPKAFADLVNFDDYRFRPGMPGFARSFTQLETSAASNTRMAATCRALRP